MQQIYWDEWVDIIRAGLSVRVLVGIYPAYTEFDILYPRDFRSGTITQESLVAVLRELYAKARLTSASDAHAKRTHLISLFLTEFDLRTDPEEQI